MFFRSAGFFTASLKSFGAATPTGPWGSRAARRFWGFMRSMKNTSGCRFFYAAFAAAALSRRWSFSSGFLSTRFFACTFGITAIYRLIFSGKSALYFRSPGFFYRSPPVTFTTGFKCFFFARRYAKTPCKNAAAFSNQPSASLPSARPIPWPPVS